MTRDVERVPHEDLDVSRRELMAGTGAVATGSVLGVIPSDALAAQTTSTFISGTVTDAQGGVGGATVDAVPHDSSLDVLRTTTDANGEYIFGTGDLHDGENLYHVIAREGTESAPRRGQENYPFIAAEGGPAIPDSGGLHARFDATELSLSDQDDVTAWSDETGNGHDLTAGTAPTYVASGINGNPVVRHDYGEFLSVDFPALSGPNSIFMVARVQTESGNFEALIDGGSDGRHTIFKMSGGWGVFQGESGQSGGSKDTNPHVFSGLYKSTDVLRVDGSQAISGDTGSNDLGGIHTGGRGWNNDQFSDVEIGEILVYPEDKSGSQAEIEQYLADKWGITL